ncbi:glutamate synthase subunit beta [Jatrophihabitans endophyticus]|uniref:glutamate synthase subunit beta n=1 Tax=Jatrophihabitans endophyticus TaxID=1206085 RepID=UPI0019E83300|nr:glutamate synthase subunit beta [Jatrophihabitans endophyticus]MBE7186869.1 glutamate synthase subunit beta [Jatrophihabitans endophyticus]
MAYDPQGFLKHERVDTPKRPAAERVRDWQPIYLRAKSEVVSEQAARCMDCGVAFCHSGCPLGNLIPEWNEFVARDDWATASERLHATNNFPEFTGWICPAPCEAACVLALNTDPVTIKQVEVSIVERAFDDGLVDPQPPSERTGTSVAVVGSGPAGLAAAQQLTRAGHAVTVFERDDRLGGLLRYGIPDFKMPKDLIDRRVEQMRAEGTVFEVNADIGPEQVGTLRQDFDAVVLAVGALAPRELDTPGRELDGVHQAMTYLPQGNRVQAGDIDAPQIDARGRHVIIVGGGDTAADCLGTANRQGALSVTVLDHNPRPARRENLVNPSWPSAPSSRGSSPAHDEGVHEAWAREVVSFESDEHGAVRAVTVEEVEIVRVDGVRAFRPVAGSRTELPAELVLLAAGFVGTDVPALLDGLGVDTADGRGTVAIDDRWQTGAAGVYACGDATRGASLVVWAIAEGRACAAAVDHALTGLSELPRPVVPGALAL